MPGETSQVEIKSQEPEKGFRPNTKPNSTRITELLSQVSSPENAVRQRKLQQDPLREALKKLAEFVRIERGVNREKSKRLVPQVLADGRLAASERAQEMAVQLRVQTEEALRLGRTDARYQLLANLYASLNALESVASIDGSTEQYEAARVVLMGIVAEVWERTRPFFDQEKDCLIDQVDKTEFNNIYLNEVADISFKQSGKYLASMYGGTEEVAQAEVIDLIGRTNFIDYLIIVGEELGIPYDETVSVAGYLASLTKLKLVDYNQDVVNSIDKSVTAPGLTKEERQKIKALKGLNRATWMAINFERARAPQNGAMDRLDSQKRDFVYNPQSMLESRLYNATVQLFKKNVAEDEATAGKTPEEATRISESEEVKIAARRAAVTRVTLEMWKDFNEQKKALAKFKGEVANKAAITLNALAA